MDKKKLIIHLISIVLIVIIILSIIISIDNLKNDDEEKGITAMEGKEIAENIAREWNRDAVLVYMRDASEMINNGHYLKWRYKYWNNKTYNDTSCIEIEIYSEKTVIIDYTKLYEQNERPISNWKIDSNRAYDIAVDDAKIKEWLSEYDDEKVDGFSLYGSYDNTTNPCWVIHWYSPGFMDDPHNAHIVIDATNGNILEVDTQIG
ncbi:MAG: hypothetical protein ACXAC2_15760 [Candidatus Kariarchaeaceae archaeon]|jgi:hypothetical protein